MDSDNLCKRLTEWRMLDYGVRLRRAYPGCRVVQVVVFLQESGSPKVFENCYEDETTIHRYRVVRIWEQDPEVLMQDPGLWPLVPLCRSGDAVGLVQRVAEGIEGLESERERMETTAFTYLLGGLRLDQSVLNRLLRKEVMRESVTYQELVETNRAIGKEQGLQEGRQEGIRQTARGMLAAGFGMEQVAAISGLAPEQVRQIQAEIDP